MCFSAFVCSSFYFRVLEIFIDMNYNYINYALCSFVVFLALGLNKN